MTAKRTSLRTDRLAEDKRGAAHRDGALEPGPIQAPLSDVGQRSGLTSQVARELVGYIVGHHLAPGSRLPTERQMVEQMGVSRGTVREALRTLEVHGLISLKPGPSGGPVVQKMDGRELGLASTLHFHVAGATFREIWEARLQMEPVMARLAAERNPEAAERLTTAHQAAREAADAPDLAYVSAVSDYHTTLSAMSGNRVLDLWAVSFAEIWKVHTRGLSFEPDGRERVFRAHDRITEAVLAGDGDLAHDLMYQHNLDMMGYVDRHFPGLLDAVVPFTV